MKYILATVILAVAAILAWPQAPGVRLRLGAAHGSTGAPVTISYVTASHGDSSTGVTSVSSNANTATAGDIIFAGWGTQASASGLVSAGNSTITDTAGDTWHPVPIANGSNGGGAVIGLVITNVGSGYTTGPTWTTSGGGCSTNASGTIVESGGSLSAVQYSSPGGGCTGIPSVVLSGGGGINGAARVAIISTQNSTGIAAAWWTVTAGNASNVVTVTNNLNHSFHGLSVQEFSGPTTLDTSADGVITTAGTSITSGTFTTANAAEVSVCYSRVEATSQTWTNGTGYTIPATPTRGTSTGVSPANGNAASFYTGQYQIFSSTQSGVTAGISSGSSAVRIIICGVFK